MEQVEHYREQAEMCVKEASRANSEALRMRYQKLAEGWLLLAAEREQFLKIHRASNPNRTS
jgi:hypothetical protein